MSSLPSSGNGSKLRAAALGLLLCLSCGSALAQACAHLASLKLDHASITAAQIMPAGSTLDGAGTVPPAKAEYCRVQITAKPSADSDIRLELWIPSGAAWNGKFEQVGNGGFAGSLPYGHMASVLALGYAVAGTDDGHRTGGNPGAGLGFTWNYLAFMVMDDPKFDLAKVTPSDLVRGERQFVAPGYSLEYRQRVLAATGPSQDFYRLYIVPGMLHCGGGAAPSIVNWQAALEAWVERGEAPGVLVATGPTGTTQSLEPFN